ncbi:Serine_hydroxymethyltransferase [Hexamita inflata]|uniref:glycine hydroxymethyltransferase n=1 Tax=Hexamita inflata TaxID=28002 RepID=A0AA86QHK4_9EUKA|nr:Serine hydroxymethyltransferase [Hexamita inflata]
MKQLLDLVKLETSRQKGQINLIASENQTPQRILDLLSTSLSNKYAEGYGNNRYYAGAVNVSQIEELTINNAKKVFSDKFDVNVQALSGSPANLAVYNTFLNPGDSILSLNLNSGGHLSHGSSVSFPSKIFNVLKYGLNKEELIDLNQIQSVLKNEQQRGKPVKMLIVGYSGYCRDLDYKELKRICQLFGTHLHVDFSHTAGLVAAKLVNDPFEYADSLMCTTHKTLRGPRGALIFSKQGDKVNKSVFPGLQGGPHMNNIAGICATLIEAQTPEYVQYQKQVLENRAIFEKQFKNKNVLFQKGSDNHMLIIKQLTDGGVVEKALEDVGIIVNRQKLQHDKQKPTGIRIGSQFITSQGYDEKECSYTANQIIEIIKEVEGQDWGNL